MQSQSQFWNKFRSEARNFKMFNHFTNIWEIRWKQSSSFYSFLNKIFHPNSNQRSWKSITEYHTCYLERSDRFSKRLFQIWLVNLFSNFFMDEKWIHIHSYDFIANHFQLKRDFFDRVGTTASSSNRRALAHSLAQPSEWVPVGVTFQPKSKVSSAHSLVFARTR